MYEVDDNWVPFMKVVTGEASDSEDELDDEDRIYDMWHQDRVDLEEGDIEPKGAMSLEHWTD